MRRPAPPTGERGVMLTSRAAKRGQVPPHGHRDIDVSHAVKIQTGIPRGRGVAAAAAPGATAIAPGSRAAVRWGIAGALGALFLWSYWPTLAGLWRQWQINPDYSGGQVVPLIAAYVVWSKRAVLRALPLTPCWWGLAVLLAAQAMRLGGVFLSYGSAEQYSLVVTVVGVVLLILGYSAARRLMWVFALLLLMIPLPRRVHGAVALPLQDFATTSAVFGLELLGYLVARDGNVLRLSDRSSVAVAEACSGLRMLTAFLIVGAALAFVVRRPTWQKAVLVIATVPVAILANTLRLVGTAVLYESVSSEVGERFFHDFAGITMMPFAFAVLVALLWLMPVAATMNAER